ncbi:MAG: hypothetical protein ACXW30_06065 [Micavibrio sp.]
MKEKMIFRSLIISLTVILLFFNSPAFAQLDIPTTGMLYNTKEAALLTYNCNKLNNGKLGCDFIQTSVRKKSKPEDLEKKIQEAKKQFPDALKEISSEGLCKENVPFMEVLTGNKTPEEVAETAPNDFIPNKKEFIQNIKDMSKAQKEDLLKTFSALQDFCKNKTENSFLELTKLENEKDSHTCIIAAGYTFKQTFIYVEDGLSDLGAWVVESTPYGPCGAVQLDRFVPEKSTIGDSEFVNWKYVAKKAITNPDGTFFGDFKCKQADENEYLYDWKTSAKTDRLYHLGCEYIEFSPL